MGRGRLDERVIDRVVDAYEGGTLKKDIAIRFGCNPGTITKYLRERGVDRDQPRAGEEQTLTFMGVTETLRYFARNWCILSGWNTDVPTVSKAVKVLRARLDLEWSVNDTLSIRAGGRRPASSLPSKNRDVEQRIVHKEQGSHFFGPEDIPPTKGIVPLPGGPFYRLSVQAARLI